MTRLFFVLFNPVFFSANRIGARIAHPKLLRTRSRSSGNLLLPAGAASVIRGLVIMGDIISFGEPAQKETVDFDEKFASSALFAALFREGMDLVKETAAYLDGAGRTQSAALDRDGALVYARESMQLTTRLMQMASWLLLHRAVGEGEITSEESRSKANIVPISDIDVKLNDGAEILPPSLCDLILRAAGLQQRIARLDTALLEKAGEEFDASDPLHAQLERIQSAFKKDV
jgi:regulator of CtrA degradation